MSEYTVYFSRPAEAIVRAEAEDPEDAIDKAWDDLPGALCHQCAGDYQLAGEWEPEVVTDEDGNEVWTRKIVNER